MHFIIAPRMVVSRGELQPQRCYRIEIDAQQLRSNYHRNDQGTGVKNSRAADYSRNKGYDDL